MAYGQPAPQPAQSPVVARILAPSAPHGEKLFQAGIGLAVGALLLIVFSCLSWITTSLNDDESMSLSGLGGFSVPGASDAQIEAAEELTSAPGVWTIIFGILLLAAAGALIARRFQGLAAAAAAVVGLAALITAIVFFSDPISALIDDNGQSTMGDEDSRGYGLWLVLIGAVIVTAAAAYALALIVTPEKFGTPSTPVVGGYPGQQGVAPQQPGNPQQDYGQRPQ